MQFLSWPGEGAELLQPPQPVHAAESQLLPPQTAHGLRQPQPQGLQQAGGQGKLPTLAPQQGPPLPPQHWPPLGEGEQRGARGVDEAEEECLTGGGAQGEGGQGVQGGQGQGGGVLEGHLWEHLRQEALELTQEAAWLRWLSGEHR